VRAELRSAGREQVILERRTPLGTCTSRPATTDGPGQIGIVLRTEGANIAVAEICANPQPNQVTVVTARGHIEEEGNFAIVVTEALHGMLIAPRTSDAPESEVETPAEEEDEPLEPKRTEQPPAAVWVQSRIVLDLPTGGFWAGVVPGVELPLSRNLGFAAEMFIGFLPIEYSDELIELQSHLVWARFGLLGSGSFGPLRLGWNLAGGFYSNRATAVAAPPLQGGSDGAWGALFGAGVHGQWPAEGRLYLGASLGVSTLLPRLDYQMSEEITREVGALLLEGGLGLGIRFGR
jgi:hypothetical protein